jgi:hypothetical protein
MSSVLPSVLAFRARGSVILSLAPNESDDGPHYSKCRRNVRLSHKCKVPTKVRYQGNQENMCSH